MTPTEFDQAVQALWRGNPRGSLDVQELVRGLSDDDFRAIHQSPPPAGQTEDLGWFLAWCFRNDAVRRASEPVPTCWDRLAAD